MSVDFRECLYGLSDVIMYRPRPLRVFDQIYMKLPDMLLQAELISRWFKALDVVFVGDGDGIAMALAHLANQGLFPGMPAHITVLDFDERVVNAVNSFARHNDLNGKLEAELYNVADPLPRQHWECHDAFYANPPWGASNDGESVLAFIERGVECVRPRALACIVIGDHSSFAWTHDVQQRTQSVMIENGFRVAEMLPEFHKYHLDDSPELTSCSLLMMRDAAEARRYKSVKISLERMRNFYGRDKPLKWHYVRDLSAGEKYVSRDVKLEPYEGV